MKQSHDARDRAQQIHTAEEFANIFLNDVEGVLLEAQQGMQPDSYLPRKDACHRALKKKFEPKNGGTGRGGKAKTVTFKRRRTSSSNR